jgi:ubiquinone/menaquinone biosynthesis C-methylase UbiE
MPERIKIDQDIEVAKEFNHQAKGYDKSYTVNTYQRKTQIMVIEQMYVKEGMTILDLGCGTGSGTLDLALKLKGTGKVIGIDLSEKMINEAKKKIDVTNLGNVEFIVGSGHSLEYDNYFDYVISTNAYHHFKNKNKVFSNVHRSLKINGVFIIQDICDDFFLMKLVDIAGKFGEKAHVGSSTADQLNNIFKSTKFNNVQIEKHRLNWFWKIMIGKGLKNIA